MGDAGASEGFEDRPLSEIANPTIFDSGLSAGRFNGVVSINVGACGSEFANTTLGGRDYLQHGTDSGVDTGNRGARFFLPVDSPAFGFDLSGWQPFTSSGGLGSLTMTLLSGGFVVNEASLRSDEDLALRSVGVASDEAFDEVTRIVPTPGVLAVIAVAATLASRHRREPGSLPAASDHK